MTILYQYFTVIFHPFMWIKDIRHHERPGGVVNDGRGDRQGKFFTDMHKDCINSLEGWKRAGNRHPIFRDRDRIVIAEVMSNFSTTWKKGRIRKEVG